jgi:hypothetical protein
MTPTAYAIGAKAAIAAFLRDATRFDPGDITFSGEQSFEVSCTVAVQYDVSARLLEDTVAGRPEANDTDVAAASEAQYAIICQALLKEAEARFDLMRELGERIAGQPYATHAQAFEFHRVGRRALWVHACTACAGSGAIRCGGCSGCGEVSCDSCNGMGSRMETVSATDHNGDSVSETQSVSCTWCIGSGTETCGRCGGSGAVSCSDCAGTGSRTRIGSQALEAQPHYRLERVDPSDDRSVVHALVECAGLTRLEQHGVRLRHRAVDVVEESRQLRETADFTCHFSKMGVAAGGVAGRVVAFGEQCRISEAGALVENLVRGDLDMLVSATARLRRFDVPMLRYTQKIARLFMASEVHQAAVTQQSARAGKSSDRQQLDDAFARVLSPGYLAQALRHIEIVVRWTSASHAYGVAALALAAAACVIAYFFSHGHGFFGLAAAVAIFPASGAIRWRLTNVALRWIGGQCLVDFATRRGIKRRWSWAW